MPETMNLLEIIKLKITKDESSENILHIEITEIVLVLFSNVNNDHQHDSRVWYTFIPNRSFRELLDI